MPRLFRCLLIVVLGAAVVSSGCKRKIYDGPTVDAFNGRLTSNGKQVSFPEDEDVSLKVIFHQTGRKFGIPIKPEGTFQIGWMPIGDYSAMLERSKKSPTEAQRRGPPGKITQVPDFKIEEGKTEYTIDLGPKFKP